MYEHQPVLAPEALSALAIRPDGCYVDGTFGRGGHSELIRQQLGPDGQLIALDRDPAAIAAARTLFQDDPRCRAIQASFAELHTLLTAQGRQRQVDGLLLDLGVSSPQLDEAERGFSFQQDGPLDMRMDNSQGPTAADWLAQTETAELIRVLREYGEERYARRIARTIMHYQADQPLTRTSQLATLAAHSVPRMEKNKHPATRTFQAIRIAVNEELTALHQILQHIQTILAPGGRLAVISFHSLEDRIVKHTLRHQIQGPQLPKSVPVRGQQAQGNLRLIGKPIRPDAAEIRTNPRARSATLRVAEVIR